MNDTDQERKEHGKYLIGIDPYTENSDSCTALITTLDSMYNVEKCNKKEKERSEKPLYRFIELGLNDLALRWCGNNRILLFFYYWKVCGIAFINFTK